MRNFREYNTVPTLFERLIVVFNYITFGLVGFVWLILVALRHAKLTPFMQYHIFQTFFLVMLYWLFSVFVSLIVQILNFIPLVNILVLKILFYLNTPFIFEHYSIVTGTIMLVLIYLCLTALQGQYSYVLWVSDIIKKNINR
ncbi:MAG: hypothetical protein LUB59_05365 [Candidatus Gastranaerophilales bacterium]|nr:hypothetical protein [Candidatus Gastranaerophilales bacterium]